MGARVSRTDYEWVYSDEPHATRRKLILAKYPQIKELMKVDTNFKWTVLAMVFIQIVSFYLLRNMTSFWQLLLIGYCFGGVINHSLMLAIHEISHNQAFGASQPMANKLFGIIANLPIGFPFSVSFKKYHLEHHRYQGDDILDTDIPSRFEAQVFTTTATKVIWVFLQPFFYALRPLFVHPKDPTLLELFNFVIQITFNIIIGQTFGWHIVWYMIGGSLIAMGLHPVAGHFISEHYIMFKENEELVRKYSGNNLQNGVYINNGKLLIPETCSYYGILNAITFNVGYHVEHHDFPSIPGTLLPKVRQIAPEYYDTLCYHTSWTKVIWKYIVDPNIGPFARVKRPHKDSHNGQTLSDNICKESKGAKD
ncbi:sphingolipid delta(4)-desaturase DES1-like [Oppia nitens]|uniref:sphingolipid delta(4)-desaturase DES1-like n=1 Tax=Oppia nitens TaxID=1686743 RepID=UPI0023DAAE86|nr:sphingolipid delta(4)-desaturase DES1-like [Oppia nitens]XP_054162560.1 sphingolipid delta(4)-desaturase DES1-like [Oppia nitens]XP_054162561.1 sphingolipid delta(4)-desaturase DES1-like [Oppia nitens]